MPICAQTFVSSPDPLARHPADRKAICRVYLASLQRVRGLSTEAAKYLALLAGPRQALP